MFFLKEKKSNKMNTVIITEQDCNIVKQMICLQLQNNNNHTDFFASFGLINAVQFIKA